jgi:hypothetical protein
MTMRKTIAAALLGLSVLASACGSTRNARDAGETAVCEGHGSAIHMESDNNYSSPTFLGTAECSDGTSEVWDR